MRKFNLISGIIWLILAILIFLESIRLGIGEFNFPGAGLFPFLTAILLALLSAVLIFEALRRKPSAKENKTVWEKDINWGNITLTLLALIIYALFLESVGYFLTTFAAMLFLFRRVGQGGWSTAIIGSILTVMLSYMIFGFWLQCQLPEGILLQMIRR